MATKKMDALIDEAVAESFLASDPSSYMAGTGAPGAPPHDGTARGPVSTELLSAEEDADRSVRERAYHLWEQEGRPDGRAEEHWYAARRELGLARENDR